MGLARHRQAPNSAWKKDRFIAHTIGALAGRSAALGAFCLSSALLMLGARDDASMALGVFGSLVLCAYFCVLRYFKQKTLHNSKAQPAKHHRAFTYLVKD